MVEELVHRLLHVFRAVCNRRQMVAVFCDEKTILILTQVNNSGLYASFDPSRVRSYFGDRLLLPAKYETAYVLQFGNAFAYCVDVTLGSVQERNTALQGILSVPGKGPQGVWMRSQLCCFFLDLGEDLCRFLLNLGEQD